MFLSIGDQRNYIRFHIDRKQFFAYFSINSDISL